MHEADFTPHIREKSQQVADLLEGLSPYERSLVIHEAEAVVQDRAEARNSEPTTAGDEWQEDVTNAACLWLGLAFQQLSWEARQALMEQAKELLDGERFQRLVQDSAEQDSTASNAP